MGIFPRRCLPHPSLPIGSSSTKATTKESFRPNLTLSKSWKNLLRNRNNNGCNPFSPQPNAHPTIHTFQLYGKRGSTIAFTQYRIVLCIESNPLRNSDSILYFMKMKVLVEHAGVLFLHFSNENSKHHKTGILLLQSLEWIKTLESNIELLIRWSIM